jgi:hypothetical protein
VSFTGLFDFFVHAFGTPWLRWWEAGRPDSEEGRLFRAEEAGYSVCIRVHDELVCETPDAPAYSSEGLAALMSTNPSWSAGLPLAAAGFEAYRYRKD